MMPRTMRCELCEHDGGAVLWRDEFCRVVSAATEDYPGCCRVILNRHVREMTDIWAPPRRQGERVRPVEDRALGEEIASLLV